MVDQEVLDSQLRADRFPFPSEGNITLRVRNANYTLGPVMLHIVMHPGATIPAHLHKGMAEALYVAEGDFTNEGKQYQAVLRCISRPARHTAHTPLRMDASFSSSGRNAPRRRPQISPISPSQSKKQPNRMTG